jgi:hypothetical protein
MQIVKVVLSVVVDNRTQQKDVVEEMHRLLRGQPPQLTTIQWAGCEINQYRPNKSNKVIPLAAAE